MNPSAILAQLEDEITWRQDELRMLHNQAQWMNRDSDKDAYRKCLVVMLYSHLEGFCKQAFSIYVEAINREGLKRRDVNVSLAASCFEEAFRLLRDQAHKQPYFRSKAPDETQLHQFYRESTFIDSLDQFFEKPVDIPVDKVVSTESNLTPVVLQKLLYKAGFNPQSLSAYEGRVAMLVARRHAIAHGRRREGIDETTYEDVRQATFAVMDGVKTILFESLVQATYRRASSPSPPPPPP